MFKYFISFIHEEEKLAHFIRDSFNQLFLAHAKFFTSSGGIPAGERWLEKLIAEIEESESILLLLSKRSLNRQWINIEAGAFWISGKNMFPICHGDLTLDELPRPFSDFQSTHLYNAWSIGELVASIVTRIGLTAPPSFDPEEFCARVMQIDHASPRIFDEWQDITAALSIDALEQCECLSDYTIINETVATNYKVYNDDTLEIAAYAKDAAVVKLERHAGIDDKRFLILRIDNAQRSSSLDLDKLIKVVINNEVCLPYFETHRHYDDKEYIYKANGHFAYDLTSIHNKIPLSVQLIMWRILLDKLHIKLYLI